MDAHAEARTYSFVTLSTLIHVAMAIGVMFLKVQIEPPQKDLTQIEILSSSRTVVTTPVASQAPLVAETPKAETVSPQELSPAPSVAAAAEDESSATVIPQKAVTHHPKVKSTAPVARKAVAQARPAPTPIPAELPEVENTDLDSSVADAQTELKEEDIADDLSKIDQEQNAKVAAVHADLNQETEKELKDQEAKLAAIEKENIAESEKMAQENAAKRAQEKQELAAQQQKAKALAAANAAAAERAKAAQEAELARQAQAAQQAEQARIQAEKNAAAMAAIAAAANQSKNTNEVRALEDLRQMPGNQHPQYDAQDRLNQRQGEVAFLAYVSREGSIVNFKMTKSSGHRELDAKTLKAIKNWRFYPGQEGWVEIPFKWDLKGGPQEMPTTLRRRAQVGQN